jgi:lysozyme
MRVASAGINLIKKYEGCRLRSYKCPAGIWTVGYGSTGPHVKPNMVISQTEAEELLVKDLVRFERGVFSACKPATPSQAEFDAMVSLAFNIGLANFKKSSVLRLFKQGEKAKAASAFSMWIKAKNPKTGELEVLPGLVTRRNAEKNLFLKGADNRTVNGSVSANKFVAIPESRVVPEAPKSLAASREIIGGGVVGVGGITQLVHDVSVDDAVELKETVQQVHSDSYSLETLHIPEIASALAVALSMFIIWKRFKDRNEGVR